MKRLALNPLEVKMPSGLWTLRALTERAGVSGVRFGCV